MPGAPAFAPLESDKRRVGKYDILCKLSTGGMSQIFLATQKGPAGFKKVVVLKSILPDIESDEEFVRMFLDEAKVSAQFNHPNIAQTFDFDVADGMLFLTMEFVQGCTLVEMARACRNAKEPIPIGFTLGAVRDTALALHYAHTFTDHRGRRKVVIHRDVAEKNIMVNYEGTTKLLDFGIAKSIGAQGRTSVGMVKGTSGYMSPEQIRGETLDGRSDVFALGVVLHECLTGVRLFHGKTAEEAMLSALKEDVAPPSAQNPEVSSAIDSVVLKALARRREERYATALEFARAIERASQGIMWLPEDSGDLVQRFFSERRTQTRALLEQGFVGEKTGEVAVDALLDSVRLPRSSPPSHREKTVPEPAKATSTQEQASIRAPALTARRTKKTPAEDFRAPEGSGVSESTAGGVTMTSPSQIMRQAGRHAAAGADAPMAEHSISAEEATNDDVVDGPEEGVKTVIDSELARQVIADRKAAAAAAAAAAAVAASRMVHEPSPTPSAFVPRDRRNVLYLFLVLIGVAIVGASTTAFILRRTSDKPVSPPTTPLTIIQKNTQPAVKPTPPQAKTPDVEPKKLEPTAFTIAPSEEESNPPAMKTEPDEPRVLTPPKLVVPKPAPPKPQPHARAISAPQKPQSSQPKSEPSEAASGGEGFLTIVAEQEVTVFLGSRELGKTPLMQFPLPAGKHRLTLRGADGASQPLQVEVKPNAVTSRRVDLSE